MIFFFVILAKQFLREMLRVPPGLPPRMLSRIFPRDPLIIFHEVSPGVMSEDAQNVNQISSEILPVRLRILLKT